MTISERTEIVPVATAASFLQWTPIIAGALVTSAVSLILIAFGSAIGFGIVSSSPTWRDTSALLTLVSGLYLLLAALASFGAGGYVTGRLRERWDASAHHDLIEFRDGTHGLVAWALAVVIIALVLAFSAASLPSKTAQTTTAPEAGATGESLIAYELDQLFRGDRRPFESEIAYNRAEAARILLKAAGRNGITPDDRAYLVQLVAARTGADAERRVNNAITAASTAIHKARRSAVILGFSTAVALLAGAVAAWYAACGGGRERDSAVPRPAWRLRRQW